MSALRGSVLVVDDEPYVRESLAAVLTRSGFQVRTAGGLESALSNRALEGIDALLADLRMPDGGGLELLRRVRELEPRLPVIILTGHGSIGSAVDCMRAGAFDYLQKPVDPDEIVLVLERALTVSAERRQLDYLRRQPHGAENEREPIGASDAWRHVVEQAALVAVADTPILIEGETGTGKGELAGLIHRRSRRARGPFVEVSCAAVPIELFEAEFFGHRKGAFTGAASDRDGRFRVAHNGTIFLDEIDALPLAAQAKVLRVIEQGRFERVGDSRPTAVDVRLVSATNRDLKADVAAGRFREDLWFRINVITLRVPPLRERREDIPLLAEAFLRRFSSDLGKAVRRIEVAAMECLCGYGWPGNVRELRNVIERGVLLAPGDVLGLGQLPAGMHVGADSLPMETGQASGSLRLRVQEAEKRILLEALSQADGVRRHAAQRLGIDERNMAYYLRKHDLQSWRPASRIGDAADA